MKPLSFRWAYQLGGDVLGEGEGVSRTAETALQDILAHIRKDFPRSARPNFQLAEKRPDQDLYAIQGGNEYFGMASVSPVTESELMLLSVALSPRAEANPRARNNWAFLVPLATQLATAIVTGLGAAIWGKLMSMDVPERAAWLEKNSNRLMAVQSLGLSLGANKLMDKIPNVPALRKKVWLDVAAAMGDPSVQAAVKEAGKSVVTSTRAKNNFFGWGEKKEPALPTLSFKDAAERGNAMERQARSRFGLPRGPMTTHFLVKAPKPNNRGSTWYFLDFVTLYEMERASEYGLPVQRIEEEDPWPTARSNIDAYGDPDDQNLIVLDTYTDTISGPFRRAEIWKLARMRGEPKPVVRRNGRRNPGKPFLAAWREARASGMAIRKLPDGRALEPILDDDYGPWFAYYENGRIASGHNDGLWEVVPASPPRR